MSGMTIQVPVDDFINDSNGPTEPYRAPRKQDPNDVGFQEMRDQLARLQGEKDQEKKRADDAETARQNADARARQAVNDAATARRDAETARTDSTDSRKLALSNAMTAQKTGLDSLEEQYASALEAGDFKKGAALQRKMSEAAAELKQLESGISAIEAEEREAGTKPARAEGRVERETQKPAATKQVQDDPFEQYISQFSATSQAWLRAHPDAVKDSKKNSLLLSAHHEANAMGYTPESEAYFAHLERKLGYRADAAARAVRADNPIDDDTNDNTPPQRTTAPMRSAPVSRGDGRGGSSVSVSLTPGEVDSAQNGSIVWNVGNVDRRGVRITKDDPRVGEPIGLEEMARRKRLMDAEGRYATPYAS